MSILQAIFLGIVQGIAEFLPVSSSGHLAIFKNIFHIETEGGLFFDVMLHLGTLAAVFVVYRKDILRMTVETIHMCGDIIYNLRSYIKNQREYSALRYRRIVKNNYRKFVVLILVSTIATGIIGILGKNLVEKANATLLVPGICLLLTAVLLVVAELTKEGKKIPKDISYASGFLIGAAQGCATLPGLSRSGTTIAACLMSGYHRKFAVRYSFLMSIPAILGATVLELKDIGTETVSAGVVINGLIGAVVAGCVGYVCIKTMLAIVRKKKFLGFAVYCFIVGVIAIAAHFIV